jgi:inner membrane protein
VDNITHSLVGVVLADAMAGRRGGRSQRPLLVGAGLIAANLPDADIAYSVMTPAPIGYLVHHRGHTHTIVGLGVLALVLVLAYRLIPPVRAMRTGERLRLWLLIATALASHLAMDALNSYGVHPFYPLDNSWYFGDAVFILEPSLWLVLGVAVAWNARTRASTLMAVLPIAILLITVVSSEVVPAGSGVLLAVAGGLLAWVTRRVTPRGRAVTAIVLSLVLIGVQLAASREARVQTHQALGPLLRGRLLDVVLTPNPSSPLCWGVIGIELRESSGEYVLWRGTLSLLPSVNAPTACASHRLSETRQSRLVDGGRLALRDEIHQPLQPLRDLGRRDCWTRAWLRFGRVPAIAANEIFDLRFEESRTQGFTHMPLARAAREAPCPSFVPHWEMPRRDLLSY